MFSRVLVGNRGEGGCPGHPRAARARDRGRRRLLHGRSRVAPRRLRRPGGVHRAAHRRAESYLGIPALIAAAETTDCEAVHPGWGSSRRTRPSRKLCRQRPRLHRPDGGHAGPHGRQECRQARDGRGRPSARPGHRGARDAGRGAGRRGEAGYPVLLKAAAGGGGKGMRLVGGARWLERAYSTAAAEAEAAFGSPELLRGESDLAGPSCRDPGARRHRGQRAHAR